MTRILGCDPVVLARFRAKTTPAASGCLLWTGSAGRKGYGDVRIGGRTLLAHRVAFEFANGHAPSDLQVLHECDNPLCVNPEHLFLGTHQENMADRAAKGRVRLCGRRGDAHQSAKLTEDAVRSIRAAKLAGERVGAIARRFGVGHQAISKVLSGQRWGHVV